jgi:DNA-directed RNA polymerase subunit RPC12/RpoP
MGLTQVIKENLPIGIEAFSRAVSEAKGKSPESAAQQYECGQCHTKFTLPREPGEDEKVICPKCGQEWTGKEVLGA